jgi:hypothetical protein
LHCRSSHGCIDNDVVLMGAEGEMTLPLQLSHSILNCKFQQSKLVLDCSNMTIMSFHSECCMSITGLIAASKLCSNLCTRKATTQVLFSSSQISNIIDVLNIRIYPDNGCICFGHFPSSRSPAPVELPVLKML